MNGRADSDALEPSALVSATLTVGDRLLRELSATVAETTAESVANLRNVLQDEAAATKALVRHFYGACCWEMDTADAVDLLTGNLFWVKDALSIADGSNDYYANFPIVGFPRRRPTVLHPLFPVGGEPEPRDAVVMGVFELLKPEELAKCAMVSKRWRRCAYHCDSVWLSDPVVREMASDVAVRAELQAQPAALGWSTFVNSLHVSYDARKLWSRMKEVAIGAFGHDAEFRAEGFFVGRQSRMQLVRSIKQWKTLTVTRRNEKEYGMELCTDYAGLDVFHLPYGAEFTGTRFTVRSFTDACTVAKILFMYGGFEPSPVNTTDLSGQSAKSLCKGFESRVNTRLVFGAGYIQRCVSLQMDSISTIIVAQLSRPVNPFCIVIFSV